MMAPTGKIGEVLYCKKWLGQRVLSCFEFMPVSV